MEEQLELLLQYIDAKIEYEFASREVGEDGYRDNPIEESKKMEAIRQKLENSIKL